jgi:hypothetical protein
MKRDSRIRVLKDIGRICDAQRQRAELEVERVNARLDQLARQREQEVRNLNAQEEGWAAAVRGGSLQLTASAVWATEILRTQAAIAGTDFAINEGKAIRQGLSANLRTLSARAEAIGDMTVRAIRQDAKRRDEAAMETHTSRTLSGWSTP